MANLLIISGSLRKDSLNTYLAKAFIAQAPAGTSIELLDWSKVPMYNQDNDADFPEVVTELKNKLKAADGIIIVTPEYNRSIPGPLKNMIDYTSRPYGDSAWKGKPVYVAGATGGAIGTSLAQAHLKNVLTYLDTHVLGQPEFYLGGAPAKFNEAGQLVDEDTKTHIDTAIAAFIPFVTRISS